MLSLLHFLKLMNRTLFHPLVFISFICLLVIGCKNNQDTEIIYFGIAQKPQTLDPRFLSDASSERLSTLIFTPLVYFNTDFSVSSNLVKINKISSKKFNFRLYENLPKFHDGTLLDINDIIATIEHLIKLKSSIFSSDLSDIKHINKVSETEFEIELNTPDHNFPTKLSFAVLPKSLLQNQHKFSINPIGSGPFQFISSKPNIKIRRIEDGQIIELVEIKDPTVRVLKLVNGEIDIVQNDLPLELVNYLMERNDIKSKLMNGSNISYVGFNFQDYLLKNVKLREAIAIAVDRKAIAEHFFNSKTRIAEQILPPEHWASIPLEAINFNQNKAAEIIKEISPNSRITLTYKTSTDPFRIKIATIIQEQLADVGIDLKIKSLDWGTYFRDIQAGNFQLYSLTWVGIRSPEIYEKIFSSDYIPPKGLNRGGYSDLSMDLYLSKAKINNDWSNVIHEARAQLGFIPLWYEGNYAAFRNSIINFEIYSNGNWDGLKSVKKIL